MAGSPDTPLGRPTSPVKSDVSSSMLPDKDDWIDLLDQPGKPKDFRNLSPSDKEWLRAGGFPGKAGPAKAVRGGRGGAGGDGAPRDAASALVGREPRRRTRRPRRRAGRRRRGPRASPRRAPGARRAKPRRPRGRPP